MTNSISVAPNAQLGHLNTSLEVDCYKVSLCPRKNDVHKEIFRHFAAPSVPRKHKKNVLKAYRFCYEYRLLGATYCGKEEYFRWASVKNFKFK